MFRISFKSDTKKYKFEKLDGAVSLEGTIYQVSDYAVSQGIDQKELTTAYQVMAENVHTVAEFGIRGCFLYSHNGRAERKLALVH